MTWAFLVSGYGSQGREVGDDNSAGEGQVARDGDDLLLSSAAGRRKVSTVERDARVGLTVYDRADPLRYLEAHGTATVTEDLGQQSRSFPALLVSSPCSTAVCPRRCCCAGRVRRPVRSGGW
ncbi:pyridoxamine 5'-phosphate oxidase family protein [Streptomyces sp900116325]|uniref:Pyridoxamine 5'-phosphate oxidase family protein n=1 Tax=Streptomyces sp. 900116325 TaxID=3154295 RepID=A0ABV2UJL1_9ACTN